MLKNLWNYKKIRFLCVGSFNAIVDLTTLNTLVFVAHFRIWEANAISVSVGITLSYFLNHFLVFRYHQKPNFKTFAKFFFVTGLSVIVLQTAVIYLSKPLYAHLIQHAHMLKLAKYQDKITLNLAKVTAILIGMVWNFILYSKIVFNDKPKSPQEEEIQDLTSIV